MTKKNMRESDLYLPVEKSAKRHFGCFAIGINRVTEYGRVGVGESRFTAEKSYMSDLMCENWYMSEALNDSKGRQ